MEHRVDYLMTGLEALELAEETADSAGLGAQAYLSRVLPSPDTIIGGGKLSVDHVLAKKLR